MCLFLPPVRRGLGVEFVPWHIVGDAGTLVSDNFEFLVCLSVY